MREQPHYTNLLTKQFFEEYYVEKRMSYPKIKQMLKNQGYNIHSGTLHKYAKQFNIGRNSSEARRIAFSDPLDYNISYLTEEIIEAIDGFTLGDGGIDPNRKKSRIRTARLRCGVQYEDFCEYLIKNFTVYRAIVRKNNSKNMKQGFIFTGSTRTHPDIYKQYIRWYPEVQGKRVKQPPEDVRLTPLSVMMWYLGDGSVVVKKGSIVVRLSTDGFLPEKVEMLVKKMNDIGILCHRSNENRININARGVPAFFNLIGRKSPVSSYNYKFDRIPFWRFESKRMKEVASELNIDYNRMCYFIKIGKIPCFRLSEKGRPRFLPEHIEIVKKLKKQGELT
jgi:hypothetical protein